MSENKLTPKQRKRFEALIEEGRNCYAGMAMILKEIRDDRLYRETHPTFKACAKEHFHIGESRAYQLIEYVEITEEIEKENSTIVEFSPLNEGQTRELAKVAPEKRVEVFEAAAEEAKEAGKPVTAAVIKRHAAKVEVLEEEDPSEEFEECEDVEDETPAWVSSVKDVDGLRRQVNDLTRAIKDAPTTPGFELVNSLSNRIRLDLSNVKAALVGCVPFNTCPYCQGNDSECDGCNGRGWVNKHDFNNAPKEMQNAVARLSSRGCK